MKKITPSAGLLRPQRRSSRGAALVIVLSFLMLLVVTVLAFFSSVTSEVGSSSTYASAVTVQKLSDSAVNLAAAQVQYATQGRDGTNDITWASQPGAIRTYNASSTNPTSNEGNIFKLYSAQNMVASASTFRADLTNEAAANARTEPALYTDLNEPVLISDTNGSLTITNGSVVSQWRASYPILDPSALGSIEGLLINGTSNAPSANYNPVTGTNPAPMPARWLYVLQDGAVVNPTGTGSNATVAGAHRATNPIVGRIAFWTDDDTCKVNINTAGGNQGTPWDIPHFEGTSDRNFARFQPVNNEFQRYPGHPATVALSTVFPTASGTNLINLAPRLTNGGSAFATILATNALPVKQERLFANIDELLYAPERTLNAAGLTRDQVQRAEFVLTANSRAPETTLFDTPRVSIWPIHADLAVNPASPYTTAFDRLSAFCSTLGSGGCRYHFLRSNCNANEASLNSVITTTTRNDLTRNDQLLRYLQNLTSREIPGFGGRFSTKYGEDRDQILAEIFDYIRITNLFDDNLGGAEAATNYTIVSPMNPRYGFTPGRVDASNVRQGSGQIVPTILSTDPANTARGFGRFGTVSEATLHLICVADATNATSTNPASNPQMSTYLSNYLTSRGPMTNNERVLQMAFYVQMTDVAQNYGTPYPDYTLAVSGLTNMTISTVMSDGSQTNANPPNPFPSGANATYAFNTKWDKVWHSRFWGTVTSIRTLLASTQPPAWASNNATNATSLGNPLYYSMSKSNYPFVSQPFVVQVPPGALLRLSSNTVTVQVYRGPKTPPLNPTNLVQTLTLNFPQATIPLPLLPNTSVPAGGSGNLYGWPDLNPAEWWGFRTRFGYSNRNPLWSNSLSSDLGGGCVIRPEFDVVRSLIPFAGDVRLIAASRDVPAGLFIPHPEYFSTTNRIVNTLTEGNGSFFFPDRDNFSTSNYDTTRKLVSGASYYENHRPSMTGTNATRFSERYMDWDNGLPAGVDGAWINKPDEGNITININQPGYYSDSAQRMPSGATFFTPNRIMPSPGMFGSLPSRVRASVRAAIAAPPDSTMGPSDTLVRPWETLLFRPPLGGVVHPGSTSPPDHLWMDLFWMPIVEPYAISEPCSTAGKINMNYQIVPYTNIRRSTALRAAMRNELLTSVPTSAGRYYKQAGDPIPPNTNFRFALNLDEVNGSLRQFESKFAAPTRDLFRSATEICNIYLTPVGQSWTSDATAQNYWEQNKLTGDNSRERPYANLYGKLTTKSNTYTVHYRVQLLKQPLNTPPQTWDETKGKVVAESRGSRQIERYIEPRANLPDFALPANYTNKLSDYYRLRILNDKRFSP